MSSPSPDTRTLPRGLRRIFTCDHRTLGYGYLVLSLAAVAVGMLLSLLMRLHRVWPTMPLPVIGVLRPEQYLALVTMHGTLMVFFVVTVAPQSAFPNLVLPEQIGSRSMALPLVNAMGFWLTALSLVTMACAAFVPGGAPIGGWSAYPPLSALADAGPGQGAGMDVWLVSLAIFCIGSTLGAVNTLVTVVRCRCYGMTWGRLPLTVWGWVTAAMLTVLAFSVLLAAIVLLLCDRHANTGFFVPALEWVNGTVQQRHGSGSPLLWLHLFWFFGHPEVYIAILPGMGLVSMILGNFARRRIPAYGMMIATTLLIGGLGILVWGHHMFVAGMNPFAGTAFELTTIAIALPSTAKVINWLAILWRSRPDFRTPLLWCLGFLSVFIAGGLSGPILAQPALDAYLNNTFFVLAHFHFIMALASVFGIFAATAYWFPLLTGRMMDERLGAVHFWWTMIWSYATFLPMYLTGLAGEPRHYSELTGVFGPAGALVRRTLPLETSITVAAICLIAGQVLWIANVVWSLRKGAAACPNPWRATTLEWAPASEQPITCHRDPCHYIHPATGTCDFLPQWAPAVPAE